MKNLLKKIKSFQLTTPIAIIIASFIISFHYIWINKYEILNNSPSEGIITIINKWSGEVCSFSTGNKGYRRLVKELAYECDWEDYPSDIKLP